MMEIYITAFYLITVASAIYLSYALEKQIDKTNEALKEAAHQRDRSLEWQEKYFEIKRRHAKIMEVLQPQKVESCKTTFNGSVGTFTQVPTK